MSKITVICASSNNNLKLAKKIVDELKERGESPGLIELVRWNAPLYTPEVELRGIPEAVIDLSKEIRGTSHFVFVAPEYNGSVPPTLVNFIAWMSRSGDNWRELFNGKEALIATHSGGGGLHALSAMRAQLSFIGMNVVGRQIQTNFQKELNIDSLKSCVDQLLR